MDNAVDVVLEAEVWDQTDLWSLAKAAIAQTLSHQKLDSNWEVVVMGCDDARIAELNTEFRDKSLATNVLSWPAQDLAVGEGKAPKRPEPDAFGEAALGDIALAFETCLREAEAANLPFEQHLTHLIVHGTLHLLGYDHISDTDAGLMEGVEVEILAQLGQPDPYER